jgi:hypothetical protein
VHRVAGGRRGQQRGGPDDGESLEIGAKDLVQRFLTTRPSQLHQHAWVVSAHDAALPTLGERVGEYVLAILAVLDDAHAG